MVDSKILDAAPAIFNFHVTKYRRIESSEDIAEFEDFLKDKAKITDFDFSEANIMAQATISECGSAWVDECDELR